ncbi:MAG: aldo/keto reductase, partial [Erysipelotrichaceae bacterium]|nr:aldo/keto reductase [Erysipelotrichaceae bacterium]
MQYRNNKQGEPLSVLGFGCMRFARKNGSIDYKQAEQQVLYAKSQGVNYFDTAYIYPGSEVILGEILAKNHIREEVNIATKLPQYLIKSAGSIEKYFKEQCKRLQTDYIDYYLMHMLTDELSWQKLVDLGIKDWIDEKKRTGQIRHIGFSFHGNTETFLKCLHAYDWDFCQVQYNYMDEHSQAGRKGVEEAEKLGIPVIIMEPLRGGKLVNMLPENAKKLIANHPSKRSAADWSLRWLWDQSAITVILSGMNSMEQVKENIESADTAVPHCLKDEDFTFIESIKEEINKYTKVGCTGCGYCQPCPKGVDIPLAFRCYNEMYIEKKGVGRREYMQTSLLKKNPTSASNCIGCGKCEQHCPQHIE